MSAIRRQRRQALAVGQCLSIMNYPDLFRQRLYTQHMSGNALTSAAAVVRSLGAVQAQDYGAATWALGQRVAGATRLAIDRAFDRGDFVRTHVMRPTWHFVAPEDVRWLLALTGPRVNAMSAPYYRKFGLDARAFSKSRTVFEKALEGGRQRTRLELRAALEKARVIIPGDDPLRTAFLVLRAELDGLLCSGPRQGKQFTYMLLDERVPGVPAMTRDEARAELTRRFFLSHGPATIKDLAWWSGLTTADVRAGIDSVGPALAGRTIDGQAYYQSPSVGRIRKGRPRAHLVPVYDESVLSYRDSRVAYAEMPEAGRDNGQLIVIDGRAVSTWRRTIGTGGLVVDATPLVPLTAGEKQAIADAVDRYGRFLDVAAAVRFRTG